MRFGVFIEATLWAFETNHGTYENFSVLERERGTIKEAKNFEKQPPDNVLMREAQNRENPMYILETKDFHRSQKLSSISVWISALGL